MNFKKLQIERMTYGPNKGKNAGVISFDGNAGEISLILSPEQCHKLFAVIGEAIVDTAKDAANNLTAECLEHHEFTRLTKGTP